MLRKLSPLDANFLLAETPRICSHVCALAVVDPSTAPSGRLTLADVRATIESRLHLVPLFRQRVVEVPLALDQPYWIEDPDFDLDFHLRELALPPPGDRALLQEQVARIFSRQLDRSRPLWELYLIHGLEHGRMAILTKVHHAAIDGVSGAEVMGTLFDLEPGGTERPAPTETWEPDTIPGSGALLGRAALGLPAKLARRARAAPAIVWHLADVAPLRAVPGARSIGMATWRVRKLVAAATKSPAPEPPNTMTAPRTFLAGRLSAHRGCVFGSLPLDQIKAVKNAFGTTVNDVILALCAGALRRWLAERGELPDEPLLAWVPISVRNDDNGHDAGGNQISALVVSIPSNESDPRERLALVRAAMNTAKERHRALPAGLMMDVSNSLPPALLMLGARLSGSLANSDSTPPANVHVSNIPGPPIPLYCAGAELKAIHPIAGIFDGVGLNITLMSYCGEVHYGIVVDRTILPDAMSLTGELERELDELSQITVAAPAG